MRPIHAFMPWTDRGILYAKGTLVPLTQTSLPLNQGRSADGRTKDG